MSRKSRFKVYGRLDGSGGGMSGTMIIDRDAGLAHVRPARRRRMYTMPLSMVADMICMRIIHNEVREKRVAKGKRKKLVSRRAP